jgi:hypothetical protein
MKIATISAEAEPPDGAGSNAEYVKSVTGAPAAKAWNVNFAALFDQVADAGYHPVHCGGLGNAALQGRNQRSIAEPIVTVRSAGRWKKSAGLAALRAIRT